MSETQTDKCEICGEGTDEKLYLPGTLAKVCSFCWMKYRLDGEMQGRLAREYHDLIYDSKGRRKDETNKTGGRHGGNNGND